MTRQPGESRAQPGATSPYLVADDLSGALDAGAAFLARGWRVVLPLTAAAAGEPSAAGELRLVSTETRNLAPEQAAARVRAVLAESAGGATLVCKKIDSTLRGPVAAEVRALLDTLAPPLVVITPANPLVGRTVADAELLVHGQPVAETEFGRDPVCPVREGNVVNLLTTGGVGGVGRLVLNRVRGDGTAAAQGIRDLRSAGARVIAADAETPSDLERLVAAARMVEPSTVFVGSGALAAAVAAAMPPPTGPIPATVVQAASGDLVFVCGSKHPRSREQINYLARNGGLPLRLAVLGSCDPGTLADTVRGDLARTQTAVIQFTADDRRSGDVSRELNALVGHVVRAIEETGAPGGWFATGGETAWELCRTLAGQRLELRVEIEPGTIAAVLHGAAGARWIVTKPGGFGDEETAQRVYAWWRRLQKLK